MCVGKEPCRTMIVILMTYSYIHSLFSSDKEYQGKQSHWCLLWWLCQSYCLHHQSSEQLALEDGI